MIAVTATIAASGHNGRRRYVEKMQKQEPSIKYVLDPGGDEPSSWRCERLAWLDYTRGKGLNSHHLVLQDDVILCQNFLAAVTKVVGIPSKQVIVSFYSARKDVEIQLAKGNHWARYGSDFYNCQAIAMPVDLIHAYVQYGDDDFFRGFPRGSDWRLRLFAKYAEVPIYMTCPSLVEHGEPKYSLLRGHGNKHRVARRFIGDDDPMQIDWTKGSP